MTTVRQPLPMPHIVRFAEKTAQRALRLEHGANIGPLGHVVCYFGLLTVALTTNWIEHWYLAVPMIVVLWLLNYSLTIGVLHMHAHRPLFLGPKANRVVDVLCGFPSFLSATEMRAVHVQNHHKFDDGPDDVTSTLTRERGLRALWYWARYGVIVKRYTIQKVFASGASTMWRRRRSAVTIDLGLVVGAAVTLTFLFPGRMLLAYWVPFVLTQLTTGYFAWLTHAPARGLEGASSSINTVGNVLNFFIFNQGYHSIHHRYPGIHWTEIPDKMPYMLDVDADVIVPYWVTLNTAWRIFTPARFRNARYGAKWQARLQTRLADGSYRSRLLPYFARI